MVEKMRTIGKDPELIARTTEAAAQRLAGRKAELAAEAKRLQKELSAAHRALLGALRPVGGDGRRAGPPDEAAAGQEAIRDLEVRLGATHGELEALRPQGIRAKDLQAALAAFDPFWDRMTPTEQAQVVGVLIERVDYDGGEENLVISFRPAGVRLVATQGPGAIREAGE